MYAFISRHSGFSLRPALYLCLVALCPAAGLAQNPQHPEDPGISGHWRINEELSDDTDDRVEAALRAAGEDIERSMFNNEEEYYRGGPEEQELYDQISYENTLEIRTDGVNYRFIYGGDYERPVYLDNRSRPISLNNLDEVEDFSFGHWEEDGRLIVEARPRDGGFTDERYRLEEADAGERLRASLYIRPQAFREAIEIERVYERVSPEAPESDVLEE